MNDYSICQVGFAKKYAFQAKNDEEAISHFKKIVGDTNSQGRYALSREIASCDAEPVTPSMKVKNFRKL